MSASGLETTLIDLLTVFVIAGGVGVFVAKIGRVPYTIALLVAGFVASFARIGIDIQLSHDLILLVVLPPLLFEGAATTDLDVFRRNLPVIGAMAVVGLVASILFLGVTTSTLAMFGFPILIGLLFATMILPTDPVSVLAIFEETGAPERLSVLVEGESLINDGVAVVIFSTLLALSESSLTAQSGATPGEGGIVPADPSSLTLPAELTTVQGVGGVVVDIGVTSLGGAVVGLVAGYGVYRVMVNLDDHMTEIVLTVVLAYGAFLLAEHYIGVSGVIATVVSGLFIGNRGREYAMSPRTKIAVFNTWETAAFVVNTFIFILLGVTTPIGDIIEFAPLLAPAIVLVLVARALAVYPLTAIMNRVSRGPDVSLSYQHVLVWGGLHGSIPIALVLGLPETVTVAGEAVAFPFREELRVLVFGVAAFSLIVQGLTMAPLMNRLGIATRGKEEELYELLLARARAVDSALEEAERLYDDNAIQRQVYERFKAEYGDEKEQLTEVIGELLAEYPELQHQEALRGERRVLRREESAIREAELDGQIGADIAEELLDEVRLKQDLINEGTETVTADEEEAYEEFWRDRAREFGVLEDMDVGDGDGDDPERPGESTPMDD